uniref:Ovule protein n=1 Tax=Mesocestoides corti TaxID=53468 RepID=A0A5K3EWF8_MESCO
GSLLSSAFRVVEYPSPIIKKTGTIKQTFLGNHKPERFFRYCPTQSTTLNLTHNIFRCSFVSISGFLNIFLGGHQNAETEDGLW